MPFPFIILSLVALALAVISCVPDASGAYTSLPMVLLWGALVVSGSIFILRRRLYRSTGVFLLHIAFIVILAGALWTHVFGSSQTLHLRTGESTVLDGHSIELAAFEIEYYPGTSTPCDFISHLSVDGAEPARVSMNNVLTTAGYRFYQSAYDADNGGTVLTVAQTTAGDAITYSGYLLLLISMLTVITAKIKNARKTAAVLAVATAFSASATPAAVPRDFADSLGQLNVYYNGRISTVSSLAHDFTVKITGKDTYCGLSANQFTASWLFCYDAWKSEACIRLRSSGSYVTLAELFESSETDPAAAEQFALISTAATGSLWKIFPYGTSRWYSPVDDTPSSMSVDQWHFTRHCLDYVAELLAQHDYTGATKVLEKIAAYQRREAAAVLPSPFRSRCELLFINMADSVIPAALLIMLGLVLFFFPRRLPSLLVCSGGGLWVALLIALNWIASGSLPMSDGYETMQWMALAALFAGIGLSRHPSVMPICAMVAGLALMVAMIGHRNPTITQTAPVLNSPLLSVHVLTVMLAYAALAIMALCSLAYFLGRRSTLPIARVMLEPAVFLLTAGIFIGAVWAYQSWGRFWGWDPKEVWALITMLVYSLPLHRSIAAFRSERFTAIYFIAAFATVIMTYFGVNFLLGGLHSYA